MSKSIEVNFKEYFFSLIYVISGGFVYNSVRGFDKYTIVFKTKEANFLKFDLTQEEKKE